MKALYTKILGHYKNAYEFILNNRLSYDDMLRFLYERHLHNGLCHFALRGPFTGEECKTIVNDLGVRGFTSRHLFRTPSDSFSVGEIEETLIFRIDWLENVIKEYDHT